MQKTFDDKKFGILISLDISKAFDSACFDIILSKLRGLNIPPNLYRMFVSFLDNCHVILPIQDFVVSKPFRRGCPQGAGKTHKYYYIPVEKVLVNFVVNDEIINNIQNEQDDMVSQYVRTNQMVNCLRLTTYGDDLW
ncbi:hypothetical protein HUG17_6630 [Dermatophagoides farinae]|uniref:Reverse transcriptase domain-containing protein n=1 Tax=Dermatophagoides farinae TaxID=6954 RepID=A0A9D4P540_DERFA|nr:hypothetical protein HUG17_6630 [Dermatophagoides farinae]